MQTIVQDFFNDLCCPPTYNFDVDSNDWAGAGIISQVTFETIVGCTCSSFVLSGNNIKANVTSVGNAGILDLSNKTINNINNLSISTSYNSLLLNNNLLTTSSYIAMEIWANNLPNSNIYADFSGNIDLVSGTNLEAILISKGWNVTS